MSIEMILKTKQKGRCVFADKEYEEWEVIEVCEYILIPYEQIEILKKTIINDYRFGLGGKNWAMILLWNGSLYNHSKDYPNMITVMDEANQVWFQALRNIQKWEELVFDYWYVPKFEVLNNLFFEKKSDV